MTREEAIKGLKSLVEVRKKYCDMQTMKDEIECLDIAIKSLEQEPSVEDIHREREQAYMLGYEDASEKFRTEPCEDCISRQALIERMNQAEEIFRVDNMESIASGAEDPFVDGVLSGVFNIREMVMQAQTVTIQPKTGHWIEEDRFDGDVVYRCSECKELFWLESGTPKDNEYHYCPKCGVKMESEDKG